MMRHFSPYLWSLLLILVYLLSSCSAVNTTRIGDKKQNHLPPIHTIIQTSQNTLALKGNYHITLQKGNAWLNSQPHAHIAQHIAKHLGTARAKTSKPYHLVLTYRTYPSMAPYPFPIEANVSLNKKGIHPNVKIQRRRTAPNALNYSLHIRIKNPRGRVVYNAYAEQMGFYAQDQDIFPDLLKETLAPLTPSPSSSPSSLPTINNKP